MAVADFDQDGLVDIVTGDATGWFGGSWSLFHNITEVGSDDGQFSVKMFTGGAFYRVAVSDWNLDGYPDLLISNITSITTNGGGTVELVLNKTATRGEEEGITIRWIGQRTTGDDPHTVSAANFNGDGLPDFVTAGFQEGVARFEFQTEVSSVK